MERFLYRLSVSQYSDRFVLKGAALFRVWDDLEARPTRDVDLGGSGDSDPGAVAETFRKICEQEVPPDGIVFDARTVETEATREMARYDGVRVRLTGLLDAARVPVRIDVGFGDALVPGPEVHEYPTLLDLPAPRLRTYSRETVIAEKLHAVCLHGVLNSRMKDFYDLWQIATFCTLEGTVLGAAVAATFLRRQTVLSDQTPDGLRPAFYADEARGRQWRAFLDRSGLAGAPADFQAVGEVLRTFLLPVLRSAAAEDPLRVEWDKGGWG